MSNKLKILYVDDEIINCQLFEINFSKKYEVYTVTSGAEGLRLLDSKPDISVVISDMKMPLMNGLQFISKAKEKFHLKNYYLFTGLDITQEIQGALDNGLILKYFRKPLKVKEIELEIDRII